MQDTQFNVEQNKTMIPLTADIVMAYVANHSVQPADLPGLIQAVHTTLVQLANPVTEPAKPEFAQPSPSAIRRSITPGGLISFIDGKPYKTLKRHLRTNGLDIEGYRARYGLPADYPATGANYSATRAELARKMGLGRKVTRTPQTHAVGIDATPSDETAPKRRGRPPKAA